MIWKLRHETVTFERTVLMGVLNLTKDSFSDGGRYLDPEAAFQKATELVADGADILDLGAESTRPGAQLVPAEEEAGRLLLVLKRVLEALKVPVSIDTTKPEVARTCLEAGAAAINDVSGLKRSGTAMARVVKEFGAGLILMHSRGTPETMQTLTDYADVVADIKKELSQSVALATDAGIERDAIVVDPGLGFAKTAEQNFEILRDLGSFKQLGFPVIVGPSRKSFIGQVTGRGPQDREFGTAACVTAAVFQGVHGVRVHEVGAMRDVIRVAESLRGPR